MDNPAEPKQRNVKAYWHAYHDGESPLGFVDRDERIWEIDTIKSKTESPKQIAWRKHLLRKEPIEGLPEDLVAAGQQLNAAGSWARHGSSGTRHGSSWTRQGSSWTRHGSSGTRHGSSGTRHGSSWTRHGSS